MPIDWDSPIPFDPRLQRVLADWLVHVKGQRNPARDDADTEADPVQFEEEDFEIFAEHMARSTGDPPSEEVLETLERAIGFSAWTSII